MDGDTVSRRVKTGTLHRVHQGVFAVRHGGLDREGRFMAAVLACGSTALLSHRSAAVLWGIREDRRSSIDVTAPGRRGRIPARIDAHRDGSLTASDRTVVRGIPCTTMARTLLDLSAVVSVRELRRAVAEAEVQRALNMNAVRELLQRSRGRRGVARLRLLVETLDPETKRTRSELERMFLALCRRAGLPLPEVNPLIDLGDVRFRPDFLWRDPHLIMETDGRRFHDTFSAFDSDRRREQRLLLAGWRVSHCTWAQVEQEPRALAEIIRGLLSQT